MGDVLFDHSLLASEVLTRVTAPLHVVEGSQTSAVDHAICDVIRQHVPRAQHTLIEGAGHMMPLTHPEPLAYALLAGIERRAPAIVGAGVAGVSGTGRGLCLPRLARS